MVSETITSVSYIYGVQKSSLNKDIYTIFYNTIANEVSDPNTEITRNKFIFPAEPDGDITNSNYYPIIVIDSPDDRWERKGIKKRTSLLDLTITISSTSMSELDDLTQDVKNALESKWKELKEARVDNINLDRTSTDHIMRDQIKVHVKTLTFSCEYTWSRT